VPLPVDPERLRRQFPALDDGDLEAYVAVTRRVLEGSVPRARAMADLMQQARAARHKQQAGEPLSAEETLSARYLAAVEKMQGRAGRG
jgi:hypothetical protein